MQIEGLSKSSGFLVLKGLGLVGIVTILLFVFFRGLPFYWGNQELVKKINYLKAHPATYNTLAIGSSVVYANLIPEIFDRGTGVTQTFNLGSSGMLSMESSYVLEKLLADEVVDGVEHIIFLTNSRIGSLSAKFSQTLRGQYSIDFRRLKFYFDFFKAETGQRKNLLQCFVKNTLHLGQLSELIHFVTRRSREALPLNEGIAHGFFALEDDPESAYIYESFRKMNKGENLNGFDKVFGKNKSLELSEKELCFFNELERLEALAELKNIKLHFLFNPNDFFQQKVSLNHELSMGDGPEFPEYFKTKYHFDLFHLNKAGAEIYSRRLAAEFLRNTRSN